MNRKQDKPYTQNRKQYDGPWKEQEDAIKRLNYQVNSYAQGLKANKTYTVAFLLPNTHDPYFASLTYHINLALLRRKYRMLLCCTDYDSSLESSLHAKKISVRTCMK